MDVFAEFEQLASAFAAQQIPYALIGGVAMAFHIQPRFTKDIDFLIKSPQLSATTDALKSKGYLPSAGPWTFPHARLTLHRFLKPAQDDEFYVDVLVAGSPEMEAIVDRALQMDSPNHPPVRVARREDIILLKKQRASPLDQADITLLQDE
jgi:hypothetical protein